MNGNPKRRPGPPLTVSELLLPIFRPLLVPGICLGLAALAIAVFWRTTAFGFVNYDDGFYVYNNNLVEGGLSWRGLGWVFTHADCSLYHPLTMLSLMLDYQLHASDAGGYHVTNVLLHVASVVMLFLVLRAMTGALWRSVFVALVFAVHPLRVESVAWVSERKDVLGTFFFILTLAAYVWFVRNSTSLARYLLVALASAAALLSKPTAVTLPFVLLLLDYWPLQRTDPPKKLVMEKIPLLVLSMGACVMTLVGATKEVTAYEHVSLLSRLGNALVSYCIYLRQTFWPVDLAVFYPRPAGGNSAAAVALSFLLLTALTAGAWHFRRERRWLLTGCLWYLGMLTPMIGLVQAGAFAHADRMMYLPQIGLSLALTWLAGEWLEKSAPGRVLAGFLIVGIAAALSVAAWHQAAYWKDSVTLWSHALDCTRNNFTAEYNLGVEMVRQGKLDDAIAHFQNAVKYKPDDFAAHNDLGSALFQQGRTAEAIVQFQDAVKNDPIYEAAHYNLGVALMQAGRTNDARSEFEKILQLNPSNAEAEYQLATALRLTGRPEEAKAHYEKAEQLRPGLDESVYNLGNDYLQQGKTADAMNQYEESLRLNSNNAAPHINIGSILLGQGKIADAIDHFKIALQFNPESAQAQNDLGNALLKEGKAAEALPYFEAALKLEPDDPWVKNNVAWLLASDADIAHRDGSKALELAAQANNVTGGGSPIILHTLAAAQADTGDYSNAVQTARQALQLAGDERNTNLAARLQAELKLYENGRPYQEPPGAH